LAFNIAINPSYGQFPALYLRGSKDRPSSESIATIKEDTSSATWRHVPAQFSAVGLIYLILSISYTIIAPSSAQGMLYVPFLFMPESSGVSRFHGGLGDGVGGAFTRAANS
jgi:hypothetical protein